MAQQQQQDGNKNTSETENTSGLSAFPWELGVFDAHCHPTDTMGSISEIPKMKAATLTVMSTRGEDQGLVFETFMSLLSSSRERNEKEAEEGKEKQDVQRVIPCFGWHPWFSHQILLDDENVNDNDNNNSKEDAQSRKFSHYQQVLTPTPSSSSSSSSSSQGQQQFLSSLPDPRPLSQFITETRNRLLSVPYALVGEVGLDRSFRLPNPWSQPEIDNRDSQITPGTRRKGTG